MQWIDNIQGWFSFIGNAFRQFETGVQKVWQWSLNHIYVLAVPVLAAIKSAWDFCATLGDRIEEKLSEIDLTDFVQDETLTSVLDVLEFVNTVFPLQELFCWAVVFVLFWGVCLFIRTIKGIKQTIAF